MIQLRSLSFGLFVEVEPLNRGFVPGHAKLKITVDTETAPSIPDDHMLRSLTEAFPRLEQHQCRAPEEGANARGSGRGIQLVDSESSANQAHLFEHLTLEMLSALDHTTRLSGVTCAYASPVQRNDVFVECAEPESGGLAALLALDAINAALAGQPLAPLYPDALHCTRMIKRQRTTTWSPASLGRTTGIGRERAGSALEALERASLIEREAFAINISGEPHYRLMGVSRRFRSVA